MEQTEKELKTETKHFERVDSNRAIVHLRYQNHPEQYPKTTSRGKASHLG